VPENQKGGGDREQGKLELKPQTFTSSDAIIQSLAWRVHY
jgi:hypothetical protein